jgi:biopolymer transport protein ExbD
VPYNVVADWAQDGRLAATDMIRPAGSSKAWITVAEHEFLSDFLPRPAAAAAVPVAVTAAAVEAREPGTAEQPATASAPAEIPDPEPIAFRRRSADEDDDVDMIPLIDISMVLLVFFIIIRAAGALAPIDVPEMKYAGQLRNDPDAVTINIDKQDEFTVYYSVRVGQNPPRSSHDLLPTPEKAVAALDELLAEAPRPPEVRIACRKDLPRERVYELRRELEGRQKKGFINSFTATVIETPQEK